MRALATVLLIAVASPAIAAPDAAKDCGVYTDRSQGPGKVTAEMKGETLIVRAPQSVYEFTLDAPRAGEAFQWGVRESDDIGRAKVERQGVNLVLDIADAPELDEDAPDIDAQPETFNRAVFEPFCPGA